MGVWSQGTVSANGLEVFYRRTGGDKPPLLLLHGYTDNGACWGPTAQALEADYDIIMPDARGHGQTSGAPGTMNTALLAQDAAAIIRALDLGKTIVFGHSMGGITALALAANDPDLVLAAMLEDPPFMLDEHFAPSAEQVQNLEVEKKDAQAFRMLPLEARIARGRADNPGWSDDELVPWAASKGEFNLDIVSFHLGFRGYLWRQDIAKVTCPLLLITGNAAKGCFVTPELALVSEQLCPTCTTAYINGAGHCIHRDRFDETMAAVSSFLKQNIQKEAGTRQSDKGSARGFG
ncbi:MAG: alpha/beta hydrolase [Anaerolineae bacterium]|nr:alpha/beta hydrolase [Anaerolineae bacterium]